MPKKQFVFLLTGKKRSGKDFFATKLRNYLLPEHSVKYSLADPIKTACQAIFGWSIHFIDEHKDVIDERYGISPRQALQFLGTDVMRKQIRQRFDTFNQSVGDNIWVQRAVDSIQDYLNEGFHVTVPDIRFPNEMNVLYKIFKVRNYNVYRIGIENFINPTYDDHESEQYISLIKRECDVLITNEMNEQDYEEKAQQLIEWVRE